MKSLYNISGILPAQCRTNPHDCGIAWSEHRRVEPVNREDIILVETPYLSAYIKETIEGCIVKLRSQYAELSRISEKAGVALRELGINNETLKPIDPKTIQVGDTVRLVGSRTITEWPHGNLEVGKDYKVINVDKDCNEGLSISVSYNLNGQYFWIYDEDLVLVESA